MDQPSSDAVIQTLLNFSSVPKFKNFLFASRSTDTVLSIEGVFVKAALDLGFAYGDLNTYVIADTGLTDQPLRLSVEEIRTMNGLIKWPIPLPPQSEKAYKIGALYFGCERFVTHIPKEIYNYLGINRWVSRRDLKDSGLDMYIDPEFYRLNPSLLASKGADGFRWDRLNNATDLTLPQLIELAVYKLNKKRV